MRHHQTLPADVIDGWADAWCAVMLLGRHRMCTAPLQAAGRWVWAVVLKCKEYHIPSALHSTPSQTVPC